MPTATSWEGHGESMTMPDPKPFSWATATTAEISERCGLDSLPINLIEQVLLRSRDRIGAGTHFDLSLFLDGWEPDNLSSQPILESETDEREAKPTATEPGKRKRQSCGTHWRPDQAAGWHGTCGDVCAFSFKHVSERCSDRLAKGRLPETVQQALIKPYDCCGDIGTKYNSTLFKHWLSNRHYSRVAGDQLGPPLPNTYTQIAYSRVER